MQKILFIIIFTPFTLLVCAQGVKHTTIYDINKECDVVDTSQDWGVIHRNMSEFPFKSIAHIGVKRSNDKERFSTATFLDDVTLLVSGHAVDKRDKIEFVEINLPDWGNRWEKLNTPDMSIIYFKDSEYCGGAATDISIVKIKKKIKNLHNKSFLLLSDTLTISNSDTVFMAGYPCIFFAINKDEPDTLIARNFCGLKIEYNQQNRLICVPFNTCSGDSGAPFWIKRNGLFFLLGIVRGKAPEYFGFNKGCGTLGVKIDSEMYEWLEKIMGKP